MAKMGDKVCLNHTSVPAVTRCEACFKPLCEECIVEVEGYEGHHFCSEKCAGDAIDKRGRIATLDAAESRAKTKKLIKNLVTLVVVIALAAAGFIYWQSHKKEVAKKLKQAQELGKKATKEAGKLADTAVKKATVPPPSTNNPIRAKQIDQ